MRRALEGPGVPLGGRRSVARQWLGPGNTNVAVRPWRLGVVPGIPPSRYPTYRTPAGYYPPDTARTTRDGTGTLLATAVLTATKEILGFNNAQVSPGTLTRPRALPVVPFGRCALLARPAPLRLLLVILSISQYFSVFLIDPS